MTNNNKCLQEIVLVCLECGIHKPTGELTSNVDFDNKYAYSHGYCSKECAAKRYGNDILRLFTEYDAENDTITK